MWETWLRTVSTEIESSAATARLVFPPATATPWDSSARRAPMRAISPPSKTAAAMGPEWVRSSGMRRFGGADAEWHAGAVLERRHLVIVLCAMSTRQGDYLRSGEAGPP